MVNNTGVGVPIEYLANFDYEGVLQLANCTYCSTEYSEQSLICQYRVRKQFSIVS